MTVEELLSRMGSRELAEWMAFERLEGPLGTRHMDQLTAMQMAQQHNIHRSKSAKAATVETYLPTWDHGEGRKVQSPEEMLANAKAWTKVMGGTVNTKKGA